MRAGPQRKPNPGPLGQNFYSSHPILFSAFKCFPKEASLRLTQAEGGVGPLCGRQRGRLCTKTVAGAAVTVAVLLLAPRCSQDEVHRCSHSLQQYIGCLEQCISVKNNPSWGHFSLRVLCMKRGVEKVHPDTQGQLRSTETQLFVLCKTHNPNGRCFTTGYLQQKQRVNIININFMFCCHLWLFGFW